MSLKVITCNVRGLSDSKKRRQIFHYVRDHDVDVVFLQETHSTSKSTKIWRNTWGGEAIFSHGESNARGVCTLLRRGLDAKILKKECVVQGRVLNVVIEFNSQKILLSNIYAPNEVDVAFFETVFAATNVDDYDHIMVGGDFNVILQEIDKFPTKNYSSTASSSFLIDFMEEASWVDVWRFAHPEVKQYTWSRRKPLSMSRLDMFLCPLNTLSSISECEIVPGILTDHSFVQVVLQIEKIPRGRGYWKFNNALLEDKTFLDGMNQIIDEYKNTAQMADASQFWEGLKITMQNFAMDFSKLNAQDRKRKRLDLVQKLRTQEKKLACINLSSVGAVNKIEKINAKIDILKADLEKDYNYKAQGAAIRAKVRWFEKSEKMTDYFFKLEKSQAKNKAMTATRRHDGSITRNPKEVLEQQVNFYNKLYTQEGNIKFEYNEAPVKITPDQKLNLEKEIELHEFSVALKEMKKGKAPGLDGWSSDFLKVFWGKIETYSL